MVFRDVYGEKAKSKRCVLRRFLKVATEVAEQTAGSCSKSEMLLHLRWSWPDGPTD